MSGAKAHPMLMRLRTTGSDRSADSARLYRPVPADPRRQGQVEREIESEKPPTLTKRRPPASSTPDVRLSSARDLPRTVQPDYRRSRQHRCWRELQQRWF
jgi:hypothetical protein